MLIWWRHSTYEDFLKIYKELYFNCKKALVCIQKNCIQKSHSCPSHMIDVILKRHYVFQCRHRIGWPLKIHLLKWKYLGINSLGPGKCNLSCIGADDHALILSSAIFCVKYFVPYHFSSLVVKGSKIFATAVTYTFLQYEVN